MIVFDLKFLSLFVVLCNDVQAHMPWAKLNKKFDVVKVYFGDGPYESEQMITAMGNTSSMDMITSSSDNTNNIESVPLEMEVGYMRGTLPDEYTKPALMAGYLDYGGMNGAHRGSMLQYTYLAQAPSNDLESDWENFFQDFSWTDSMILSLQKANNYSAGTYEYENQPLMATFKNYGEKPYEVAINGVPGMMMAQACLYDLETPGLDETNLGCTDVPIQEYDGESFTIEMDNVNATMCANKTYYVRAKVTGIYDATAGYNISYYSTVSSVWDPSSTNVCDDPVIEEDDDDHSSHDHSSHDHSSHDHASHDEPCDEAFYVDSDDLPSCFSYGKCGYGNISTPALCEEACAEFGTELPKGVFEAVSGSESSDMMKCSCVDEPDEDGNYNTTTICEDIDSSSSTITMTMTTVAGIVAVAVATTAAGLVA